MKTTYKTLAKFLASINLTERQLKEFTGVSIPKLRAMYKRGNFTNEECMLLLRALSIRQVASMTYASQAGNFNQNGTDNEQHTIINNYVLIIMRRLGLVPGPNRPSGLPVAPRPVVALQQRIASELPASQVAHIKGVASAGCVC